ncbi:MAG: GspF family T2SS innner membrane protein variant XcpS [Gammaproteobacteria bacterium]
MGAFEFVALDERGRQRKGVREADTARQIRQQLRESHWTPLEVREVSRRGGKGERAARFGGLRGISATDLALITRQLATLVRSALPVEEALQAVARQTEKPRLKAVLLAVRARVIEGHSLAAGLQEFPRIFPELYRATVAAGEQSGHLDVVLERLADYTERRQMLRQKMGLALFYPLLLTVMAVLVTGALLAFVVPQVVQVFADIGQQLPPLTRALIAISEFVQNYGLIALLVAAGLLVVWMLLLRREAVRYFAHRWLLRLPVVAKLVRGLNTARFARTFSILTGSGVPVLEGLRISAQVLSNLPMRRAVMEVADRVREGASIHVSLEKTGLFPPMVIHLIASGEASGNLEEMLERAAGNQEREVETFTAALLGIFEPVLILAMGGLVLLIVVAILLPVFELNQLVR